MKYEITVVLLFVVSEPNATRHSSAPASLWMVYSHSCSIVSSNVRSQYDLQQLQKEEGYQATGT